MFGGTEIPSKRKKQAEKFKNLKAFWTVGGEGNESDANLRMGGETGVKNQ